MIKSYLIGPYTAETATKRNDNITRARRYHLELIRRGFANICPHSNTAYFDIYEGWMSDLDKGGVLTKETWMALYAEWIPLSQVVFLLPRWEESEGSRRELELAKKHRIKIFPLIELEKSSWPEEFEDRLRELKYICDLDLIINTKRGE